MLIPGQTLENPVTGERFTFTDTEASSNGELLGFDFALRVGGAVPIPHVHPVQTERFEVREGLIRAIPFRRLGTPEDVAKAVLFFASDYSDYVTGQVLSVSGGLTMAG